MKSSFDWRGSNAFVLLIENCMEFLTHHYHIKKAWRIDIKYKYWIDGNSIVIPVCTFFALRHKTKASCVPEFILWQDSFKLYFYNWNPSLYICNVVTQSHRWTEHCYYWFIIAVQLCYYGRTGSRFIPGQSKQKTAILGTELSQPLPLPQNVNGFCDIFMKRDMLVGSTTSGAKIISLMWLIALSQLIFIRIFSNLCSLSFQFQSDGKTFLNVNMNRSSAYIMVECFLKINLTLNSSCGIKY